VGVELGKMANCMKIGDVARQTGLSLRTLRYYEELGLIAPLDRTKGGFRLYDGTVFKRLEGIQSLHDLKLSLGQIKELMTIEDGNDSKGAVARALLPRLRKYRVEADRQRAICEAMIQDFNDGIRILARCQACTRMSDEPHCGNHRILLSEDLVPTVVRCLFL
jgi:DNA-binding transcriptional MerR regulator